MRSAIRIAAAVIAAAALCLAAGSAQARVVQTFGNTGPDRLRVPDRIVYGPDGLLHVVDTGDAERDPVFVRLYTPAGAPAGGFRVAAGHDGFVPAMAVDAAGDTYLSVFGAVLEYSPSGVLLARLALPPQANGERSIATGLGVDPAGRLVVFDGQADRVDTYAGGRLVTRFALRSLGGAPPGGRFTSVGESGLVYVGDRAGITALDSTGAVVRRVPRPAAFAPAATYVDGPDGTLYGFALHRIQKLGPDGAYLGAVATERVAAEPFATVAADGSIYATTWHAGGVDGVVLKLAPITSVDLTRPTLTVRSFSSSPLPRRFAPRTRLVLGRMVVNVSEDAAYRVSLKRRAATRNPRDRMFGRYIHIWTVDVPHIAAGSRRLVLDWRSFGYLDHLPPAGRYQLTFVATDDAGNESRPERVVFTPTRSGRSPRR